MDKKNPKNAQNFITSKKVCKDILSYTNINKNDHVLEIGSGKGHFTNELLKISGFVTAIEIEDRLYKMTKNVTSTSDNIEVINHDILKFNFHKYHVQKIFGNIPFNISTDIIKKITFESHSKYNYLIVEYGFAKRLLDTQRALCLLLMLEVDVKIIKKIARVHFHPQPKTDAVLILLERHSPLVRKKDYKIYKDFVHSWVNKKYRKLFTNNQFKKVVKYAQINDLNKVTKEQFISIFNSYKLFNGYN